MNNSGQLSTNQAKHLALAAQGFGQQLGGFAEVLQYTQLFQLDSVNVFERAHLLPAFSRMGHYPLADFEDWAFVNPQVVEYWAHCAALIPMEDWGLFGFRRSENLRREKYQAMFTEQKHLVQWIRDELSANGPMLVSQFEHEQNRRTGGWWGWSEIKIILERMYFCGELVSAGRTKFSRRYALPEQFPLPESRLSDHDQKLELIRKSVRALGVGTIDDIADYFRFYPSEARPYLGELVAAGEISEVSVEGWQKPGFTVPGTNPPESFDLGERQVRLLSPFDPVTWRRERAQRLFDFDYKIEIYVPEAKRSYGYYTLPILYRDQIVGRVDLKNDRKAKALNVLSLWHEPWVSTAELKAITPELVKELKLAAKWVRGETLNPPSKGNWALGRV